MMLAGLALAITQHVCVCVRIISIIIAIHQHISSIYVLDILYYNAISNIDSVAELCSYGVYISSIFHRFEFCVQRTSCFPTSLHIHLVHFSALLCVVGRLLFYIGNRWFSHTHTFTEMYICAITLENCSMFLTLHTDTRRNSRFLFASFRGCFAPISSPSFHIIRTDIYGRFL